MGIDCVEQEDLYTIRQFADLFGVSLRTLRLYEERELLRPVRNGNRRLFTSDDKLRMEIIAKAKRFGFSLAEIWQLLRNPSGATNTKACDTGELRLDPSVIARQLERLTQRRASLALAIDELQKALEKPPDDPVRQIE